MNLPKVCVCGVGGCECVCGHACGEAPAAARWRGAAAVGKQRAHTQPAARQLSGCVHTRSALTACLPPQPHHAAAPAGEGREEGQVPAGRGRAQAGQRNPGGHTGVGPGAVCCGAWVEQCAAPPPWPAHHQHPSMHDPQLRAHARAHAYSHHVSASARRSRPRPQVPCVCNEFIGELLRGIRLHFTRYLDNLKDTGGGARARVAVLLWLCLPLPASWCARTHQRWPRCPARCAVVSGHSAIPTTPPPNAPTQRIARPPPSTHAHTHAQTCGARSWAWRTATAAPR
jgi:hypothetical protein